MTFTREELNYLATQRLGRLATVSPEGQVQNSPTGFFVDAETGTIDIGGHELGKSKKFRNVQAGSTVAFVVDDLASVSTWVVRGVEIRGTAQALTGQEPPFRGFSGELIRITPNKIISWGLDGPASNRKV
ncbi:PPOX class F420-dependent oxidoreductase [Nonomuraea sp. SYSU D8015]|uniref:PPOX class F420-dependent oxidoreductase n=1 Tax=Nonomuraea sp. SYSU D8015 TaxID=2593644 RepID=UPI0016604F21|nr:PPOX class F420-dependent oxidoreductase [Nonomuraea sp. SYSU D8015]